MYFGGMAALKDVDFDVSRKEIVGVIGPNGSGKTTLFNCVAGVYKPTSGIIKFGGRKINGLKPHEICKLGIGRTFQIAMPFRGMSTLENVMVGLLFGRSGIRNKDEAEEEAVKILALIGLREKTHFSAENLTIADLKKLEVAKALATKPYLLLLDEVMAGLNPTETLEAMDIIRRIRDEMEIALVVVEHVMKVVMRISDRIVVLHHGERIADGTPREISNDKKVIDAYLGERYVF
jgi:branched-chain amino acid transport system ATP-binding protein